MAAQNNTDKTTTSTKDPFELTKKEIETMNQAFTRLDRNGDGRISKDELKAGLIYLGESPTKKRLAELFGALDKDGSGYIEQEEFKNLMAEKFMEDKIKHYYTKAAFKLLDKDGDGFISKGEVNDTVTDVSFQITPADVNKLVEAADTNGDGKINYKEFSRALWRQVSESNVID